MTSIYDELEKTNQYPRGLIRHIITPEETATFRPRWDVGDEWVRSPMPTPQELKGIEHGEYVSEIEPLRISESEKAKAENKWYKELKGRFDRNGQDNFTSFLDSLDREIKGMRRMRDNALKDYCAARDEEEALKEKLPSDSGQRDTSTDAAEEPSRKRIPDYTNEVLLDQARREVSECKEKAENRIRLLALLLLRRFIARAVKWCYGILGDDRPWKRLKMEVAPVPTPPFNDRPRDYLKAALEVGEEAPFDSLNAYCQAIGRRAPKEDGDPAHPNTVRDWLIRDGFYESNSDMKVKEVRELVEETARTYLSEPGL